MELKLTQSPSLREALINDFGFEADKVTAMTDEEVNYELIVIIGDTKDRY